MAKINKNNKPAPDATGSLLSFEHNGKKYNVLKGANVPLANGVELLTAADICISTEAQKYLVENGCSCIEEAAE
jgi:hypothetical protein